MHPDLIAKLKQATSIRTRRRGHMTLTTAGRRERLPLHEAKLTIDIGGYIYTGWFVIYKLAKYDIILGKNWMEEVPHHVDLKKNVLWLGQSKPGGKYTHKLKGLVSEEGKREWTAAAAQIERKRKEKKKEGSHTLFAEASVPKSRSSMAAEAKPDSDAGKEKEESISPARDKERSIEVVDFMVAEIMDDDTYKRDCARAWPHVFGRDKD